MEAINNMAASAARAVWGDSPSTAEPVSGRTGDTSKGEPYDAGNMDPPSANVVDDENNNDGYDNENNNYKLSSENRTAGQTSGISVDGGADNKEDTKTTHKDAGDAAAFAKSTGTAAESQDTPNNPSTELKAKAGLDDTTEAQNDTRSPEDPKTNPKSAPTDVNDTSTTSEEGGLNEAQQLDGPGPKPVEDLARENGGDAGNVSSTSSVDKTSGSQNEEEEGKKAEDKDKDNENKGTGEKYVRSNGLKADGGDFDATQPGAGREADRLMEEKGIHNPTDPDSKGTTDNAGTKEKKSLGKKIKDKLHRH